MRSRAPFAASLLLLFAPSPARCADAPSRAARFPEGPPRWVREDLRPGRAGVLFDLDGDGAREIIFSAATDGTPASAEVIVLRGDGSDLKGWPKKSGLTALHSPLVGDLDGDGKAEVVVTDGARVTAWNGAGTLLGRKAAAIPSMGAGLHAYAEAALGDVDGDGAQELVFGVWAPRLAAVKVLPAPRQVAGFPVGTATVSGASPALADLDGDGRDEIVLAVEKGPLYIVDVEADGVRVRTARDGEGKALDVSSRSSPVVGDLSGGGEPSILLGSYLGLLRCLDGGGAPVWSYATGSNIYAPPTLVDLDGDGNIEVVFATYGRTTRGLRVLSRDGAPHAPWGSALLHDGNAGVVAGDLDGDGTVDLLAPDFDGDIVVYRGDGAPMGVLAGGGRQPMLGDTDGDGRLELVLLMEGKGIALFDLPSLAEPPPPWPMERYDARRSGSPPIRRREGSSGLP